MHAAGGFKWEVLQKGVYAESGIPPLFQRLYYKNHFNINYWSPRGKQCMFQDKRVFFVLNVPSIFAMIVIL